jgi:Fur family transcriptional regulator, ferric uptake regulator
LLNNYRILLQKQGLRTTPQRLAILCALAETGQHMTPLEVYQFVRRTIPGITEPTVYRALNFLANHGLLLAAHLGSGQQVYESADHNHHHLICRKCGRACEINHEIIKPVYDHLTLETGYQVDGMHITFFGLCPECLKFVE